MPCVLRRWRLSGFDEHRPGDRKGLARCGADRGAPVVLATLGADRPGDHDVLLSGDDRLELGAVVDVEMIDAGSRLSTLYTTSVRGKV